MAAEIASTTKQLAGLNTTHLRHIAGLVGLTPSGNKAAIAAQLSSTLFPSAHSTVSSTPLPIPSARGATEASTATGNVAEAKRKRNIRVLSIDMGIRNLAYCVLDVGDFGELVKRQGEAVKRQGEVVKQQEEGFLEKMSVIQEKDYRDAVLKHLKVSEWRRLAVSPQTVPSQHLTASPSSPPQGTTTAKSPNTTTTNTPQPLEFTPRTFALVANNLVTNTFLRLKPTHILIERQRFRSGGGSAVLEWTLRVNTLESMFFAVLECLRGRWVVERGGRAVGGLKAEKEVGESDGERVEGEVERENVVGDGEGERDVLAELDVFPEVVSISPRKVATFWIGPNSDDAEGGKKQKSSRITKPTEDETFASTEHEGSTTIATTPCANPPTTTPRAAPRSKVEKEAKIALAEFWLTSDLLRCEGSAAETREAFLARRNGRRGVGVGVRDKAAKKEKKGVKGKRGRKGVKAEEEVVVEGDVEVVEEEEVVEGDVEGKVEKEKEKEQITKLDDLADCALQGAAWAMWEINKMVVAGALERWKVGEAEGEEDGNYVEKHKKG